MIEIVELTGDREPEYDEFIASHPATLIYTTLAYREFLKRAVGGTPRYLLALEDGRIAGALPCFVAHDPTWGDVVNSLPWYGSYGGCVVRCGDCGAIRSRLLTAWRDLVSAPSVSYATVILSPDEQRHVQQYAAALEPTATDRRVGQITGLPADGDALEARLATVCRQKTRNLVNKALKQGFELHVEDDDASWRFLHATHAANMSAIGGQAKPWSHFAAIRAAIPSAWRRLFVTRLDGQPVSAMLLFRFNETVEYVTPVIEHEFRSRQPLSFAIWHAMVDAIRSGFRWWNWGGTWETQQSLYHFKRGWGAAECPYSYLVTARSGAVEALRAHRAEVLGSYPYYFVYPFSALDA